MASFAQRMQGVADRLLNQFDERPSSSKITLRRKSTSSFDFERGANVITDGESLSLTGVVVPYSTSLINGTAIQSGDIKLSITNAVEPLMGDKVYIDGKEYSIVSIVPVAYTGKDLTINYFVQIRG